MTKSKRRQIEISPQLEELLLTRAGAAGGLKGRGGMLQELADSVKALSDGYVDPRQHDWSSLYGSAAALRAYLLYYLPVNLVKIFPVLGEVERRGAFAIPRRRSLSVLDIGCGPGTFLLGVLEFISAAAVAPAIETISLTGIDRTKGSLSIAEDLLTGYRGLSRLPEQSILKTSLRQGSLIEHDFLKSTDLYDLIIAGNVLAELPDTALGPCLDAAALSLAEGGAFIIIDPGTRQAARRILEIRKLLLQKPDLRLCAPCLSAGECPLRNDPSQWCHDKLFWQPTEAVRQIDALLGFTKEKGIKYSFLAFVKADAARTREAGKENVWRVSSYVIRNKGEERLWVCNGRERRLLRLLDRNRSETNSDFALAERGDIVLLEGATPKPVFDDLPRRSVFAIVSGR